MRWLGLCFIILPLVSLAIARKMCRRPTLRHVTNYSEEACCIPVNCSAGTAAKLCENDGERARCVPCPVNTYMSTTHSSKDTRLCQRKRACDDGQSVADERGPTQDRVCECDLEKGFFNKSVGDPCIRRDCDAGKELTSDGGCKPCSAGSFKPEKNYLPCRPKRSCVWKYESHGNVTHDSVCQEKEEAGSQITLKTEAPKVDELKEKEKVDPFNWQIVAIAISVVLVAGILAMAIYCCVACVHKHRLKERQSAAEPHEAKGMLRGSANSTPESSLTCAVNPQCNGYASYRDQSIGFSSLTASLGSDTASVITEEVVNNMPQCLNETRQKHLYDSNSSADSGFNLLETDCVALLEDETITIPKQSAAVISADISADTAETLKSVPSTLNVQPPPPHPVHIGSMKNCNVYVMNGDNNKLIHNPIPSSTQSDSEDEHLKYDVDETEEV